MICGICILIVLLKSKHFFRALFACILQGIGALFAVNALGLATGVTLGVNWYTLAVSAIGGTPAVIMMLAAKLAI